MKELIGAAKIRANGGWAKVLKIFFLPKRILPG
jgi:hypothetical protein